MKYINLTPVTIKLNDGREFPVSGAVAKVKTGYTDFNANSVCQATFGDIEGLPEPEDNTLYIVSGLVAAACKGRADVIAPATGHPAVQRDANKQIVSVPGFIAAV